MKLLCALMIAGECIAYHPIGTTLKDIAGYWQASISCEIDYSNLDRKCKIPYKKFIYVYGSGNFYFPSYFPSYEHLECKWSDKNSKEIIDILKTYKVGTEISYSCTKKDIIKYKEKQKREQMTDIQKYNED